MVKDGIKRKSDNGRILFIIVMLAIPIISFLFFYVYVNINSIIMAFQRPRYDGSGIYDWTFDNFRMFFEELVGSDSDILLCLLNTVIFFCQDMFISLPLSLIICYFIFKKISGYKFFRTVIYLPIIISSTVFATLYRYLVGTGGPLFAFWQSIGKEPIYFFANSDYALTGILFFVIYSSLGARFVLFGGAMNAIDDGVIDAGKIDGAGTFRELFNIVIPAIWPTLGTLLLLSSVGLFTASGPILLFTKGEYRTNTLSFWIYGLTTGITGSTDYEYASAIGIVFTLLGLPLVLVVKRLTGITEDK